MTKAKEAKHWLSEDEYAKARGQLKLQYLALFSDFTGPVHYGLREYIPVYAERAVRLAEDYGLRVRGVDKPISYEYVKNGGKRKK